jgi:hypothetical protein
VSYAAGVCIDGRIETGINYEFHYPLACVTAVGGIHANLKSSFVIPWGVARISHPSQLVAVAFLNLFAAAG